jgi:spore coat protein U-like protein
MIRKRNRGPDGFIAAAVLVVCGHATPALAGADCTVSASGVNFGVYDPLATQPDDSTSSITVTCNYVPPGNTTVAYTVAVSNGMNASSPTTRSMASGTARLGYNVFNDAARSQVLGTGVGGTVVARGSVTVGPGSGNSSRSVTHTFYGRVPQALDPQPGAYNDSLVLTLTY